jgi:PAS domain S-box-containing protein
VSGRWLELMGYDRAEEVLGRHIGEVEEPASAARIAAAWERLLAEGEVRDLDRRFVRRDGAVLDVLVSARVERRGEAWWVVAAVTDVTGASAPKRRWRRRARSLPRRRRWRPSANSRAAWRTTSTTCSRRSPQPRTDAAGASATGGRPRTLRASRATRWTPRRRPLG